VFSYKLVRWTKGTLHARVSAHAPQFSLFLMVNTLPESPSQQVGSRRAYASPLRGSKPYFNLNFKLYLGYDLGLNVN
jgi:hypothetical protein